MKGTSLLFLRWRLRLAKAFEFGKSGMAGSFIQLPLSNISTRVDVLRNSRAIVSPAGPPPTMTRSVSKSLPASNRSKIGNFHRVPQHDFLAVAQQQRVPKQWTLARSIVPATPIAGSTTSNAGKSMDLGRAPCVASPFSMFVVKP